MLYRESQMPENPMRVEVAPGEVFGMRVVISEAEPCPRGTRRLRVRCACGREDLVHLRTLRAGKGRACLNCRDGALYERIATQSTPQADGCWTWSGYAMPDGYPRVRHKGGRVIVSRALLTRQLGRALSTDEMACHTCDRPWCVNPDHLFVGHARDNSADMAQKNRSAFGAHHPRAKLDDERVRAILSSIAAGASKHALAKEYGVSKRTVQFIAQRRTWQRVSLVR